MNENITHQIIQYLQVNSNYAIILSGEYGIGKTHFLKTIVFHEVEQLPIRPNDKGQGDDNGQKNFKTIHISLFGAKNIEDIQKALFLEIYPLLKSKTAKISKGILKGVGQFFSIDIDEIIADTKIGAKQSGFENFLICIDDIDRKNPALDLTEVYGYVNDLVENHGAKIILIANEDRLREEQNGKGKDDYSTLREKVIGVTIPFVPDLNNAFNQIIEENYKSKEESYYKFLKLNQNEIVRVTGQANNNLRNLLFFLEHFRIVFNIAMEYFSENPELEPYTDKLKKQILAFTLPISIEYKLGKLTGEAIPTIKDYYSNNFDFRLDYLKLKNKDRERTYREEFAEKYFKDIPIEKNFFPSIYNYLLGSDEFTKEKFGADIAFYMKLVGENIPDEQKLLHELGYWDCMNLSETDYKAKTEQLLAYMKNGGFPLDQYITVFHFATRFKNLLGYNLEELKVAFLKSLQDNISKFEEVPGIKLRQGVPNDAEYRHHLIQINEECLKINEQIKKENLKKHWLKEYKEFKENFNHFIDESGTINSATSDEPYLSYFPAEETATFILSLSNIQIVSFSYYLQNRYKHHNAPYISADRSFLEILQAKTSEQQIEPAKDKIDRLALQMLHEEITNVLKIINPQSRDDTDNIA